MSKIKKLYENLNLKENLDESKIKNAFNEMSRAQRLLRSAIVDLGSEWDNSTTEEKYKLAYLANEIGTEQGIWTNSHDDIRIIQNDSSKYVIIMNKISKLYTDDGYDRWEAKNK